MGDRAMAQIKLEKGSLYFYTHSYGSELPKIAAAALVEAESRSGDEPYAVRRIIDILIRDAGGRDTDTGSGIMLKPNCEDSYNNDEPSVIIDVPKWKVITRRPERE